MFAEFGRVPVFCVADWCSVVIESCFEVGFCESNVRFRSVIVVTFDSCLVDDWWLKAVSIKRACDLLSAVAWFVISNVICGFGWIQDALVVIVDNLFSIIHATVADLDGVLIEDFSEIFLSEQSWNRLVRINCSFFLFFLFSIYITLYFNVLSTLLPKNRNTYSLYIYIYIDRINVINQTMSSQ